MIIISDKKLCTGCGACASICPHNAITLDLDKEGFYYPEVDATICTDCGLCEQVCHMLHPQTSKMSFSGKVFAAHLKDIDELKKVSSGGVAWALTCEIIKQGGIVYGAVQENLATKHVRAQNIEEAKAFRRSKYQESYMGTIYRQVRSDLNSGMTVFFTGTGCQIAGLYAYLQERPVNLLTSDMVCHSIPSLRMFKDYIHTLEYKERAKATGIVYRDKSRGWKYNQIAISLDDGRVIKEWCGSHPYHSSYLVGLISRPACENCKYQRLERIADITLADFWKYQGKLNKKNNDAGMSLVVCSTKAGIDFWAHSLSLLDMEEVSLEEAINSCRHLTKPAPFHPQRNMFFTISRIIGFMMSFRLYRSCRTTLKFIRQRKKRARQILTKIYRILRRSISM